MIEQIRKALRTFAAEELPLPDRIRLGNNVELEELRYDEQDEPYLPFLYRGDLYQVPVFIDPNIEEGAVLELFGERYVGADDVEVHGTPSIPLRKAEPSLPEGAETFESAEEGLFVLVRDNPAGESFFVGVIPQETVPGWQPVYVNALSNAHVFDCEVLAREFADDHSLSRARPHRLMLKPPKARSFDEWAQTLGGSLALKKKGFLRKEDVEERLSVAVERLTTTFEGLRGLTGDLRNIIE